ncbi:MAG: hypothetical protein RRC07_08095 [Anaerolineae bacterium]|nr:hypothetical protein [Anaerolineae bacterium]
MSIPSSLYARLRTTLLTCWSYDNDYQAMALFLDPRLSPWRHGIPQAGSKAGFVDALIGYLHDKRHTAMNRSALVLLLEVLGEQIDPGDRCAQEVQALAGELEAALGQQATVAADDGAASKPDRTRLLRLLTAHFGEEELRDLCFYLEDVEFDSLPGRGKSAKARELILYLERRNQLGALQAVGRDVRPDVPWDEGSQPV